MAVVGVGLWSGSSPQATLLEHRSWDALLDAARVHLKEIREAGGMAKAIQQGIPKRRIEASAARRQARIDSVKEIIVGVNAFKEAVSSDVEVRSIDNAAVRNAQVSRLEQIRPALKKWFKENARDLPWRYQRTPYRVWISEIMLQQTQVATVIAYYNRGMTKYPSLQDLAKAKENEVRKL